MLTKAKELQRGDIFRMHVYGQVLVAVSIAGGKRVKVKISLEDQGQRANAGALSGKSSGSGLEFTDENHVLEFICRPGRSFHLIRDWDDDDGDELEPVNPPDSGERELV